ncbi:hypothetical protein MP228_010415 [Amoeboaphelidium protococcarum]|nr:hypothetical protein MP228_010415 [Amoeboaphelidium protococcarum]
MTDDSKIEDVHPSFIGVILAVCGSSLIGLSYTASKSAHNRAIEEITTTATTTDETILNNNDGRGVPGYGDIEQVVADGLQQQYQQVDDNTPLLNQQIIDADEQQKFSMVNVTKYAVWWVGIALLVCGEILNFMAYGFAPTSVIAPLGTMSIISGALSGYAYLHEKISLRNLIGMIVACIGATVIVLFSRSEEPQLTPEGIVQALCQLQFIIYGGVTVFVILVLLVLNRWKVKGEDKTLGDKFILIRVSLTSLFSGITVLATKSLSSMLGLSLYLVFTYWITYVLVFVLLVTALLTLYFTNAALSAFDSTVVLPAEFAAFTFTAVLGSSMLYNDFEGATVDQVTMFFLGCLITFIGVYLITSDAQINGRKPVQLSGRESMLIMAGAFVPVPYVDSFYESYGKKQSRLSSLYQRNGASGDTPRLPLPRPASLDQRSSTSDSIVVVETIIDKQRQSGAGYQPPIPPIRYESTAKHHHVRFDEVPKVIPSEGDLQDIQDNVDVIDDQAGRDRALTSASQSDGKEPLLKKLKLKRPSFVKTLQKWKQRESSEEDENSKPHQ